MGSWVDGETWWNLGVQSDLAVVQEKLKGQRSMALGL